MAFPSQSQEEGGVAVVAGGGGEEDTNIDVHTTRGTPIRYLPLDHLYSATSPCSGSTNVMSKKVKAHRKLTPTIDSDDSSSSNSDGDPPLDHLLGKKTTLAHVPKPPLLYVYSRRRKRHPSPPFHHSLSRENGESESKVLKRRKIGSAELENLGVDLNGMRNHLDGPRLRECRTHIGNSGTGNSNSNSNTKCGGGGSLENLPKLIPESRTVKRWVA